jgi:hypothetical protein
MVELKAKSGQLRACCLLRKRRAEGSENRELNCETLVAGCWLLVAFGKS